MPDYYDDFNPRRLSYSPYDWVRPRTGKALKDNPMRTPQTSPYSFDEFWVVKPSKEDQDKKPHAMYSDRMSQWSHSHPETHDYSAACKTLKRQLAYCTLEDLQPFLDAFFKGKKSVKAVGLSRGCNASTGYEYFVFYYLDLNEDQNDAQK